MRTRALVHVGGPPGAGKTTLIESLLRRCDGSILAARCVSDDSLRRPRETAPRRHPELRRYREAGASGVALFQFPSTDADGDAFFETALMQDYSQGVVVEGDCPIPHVDLRVFVAPALGRGRQLLVRRSPDRASKARARHDSAERLLRQPDGMQQLMASLFGEQVAALAARVPSVTEEARAKLLAEIAKSRRAPTPKRTQRWAIAEGYAGIEHAQLVVVNLPEGASAEGAQRVLADLQRLRKDASVLADVLGWRGTRIPITAVAANLADPADPGTRKALARIQRSARNVG